MEVKKKVAAAGDLILNGIAGKGLMLNIKWKWKVFKVLRAIR